MSLELTIHHPDRASCVCRRGRVPGRNFKVQPRVFLNVAVFQAASVSDVRQGGKLEKIPSIEHKHAVEWFQRDVETAGRPSITPTQKRLILY